MKSTSVSTKIITILLLLAVIGYFAVQGYNYFVSPETTTLVYRYHSEQSIALRGYVVRDEQVVDCNETLIELKHAEGERVGQGDTIASVYRSADALNATQQLETLRAQKEQLEYAKSASSDAATALRLDTDIREQIISVRAAYESGAYSSLDTLIPQLKTTVLKREYAYNGSDDLTAKLDELNAQITALSGAASGGTTRITAPVSGTYSAVADGYESVLTPEVLETMTPSQLSSAAPQSVSTTVGKLIQGSAWYFAANVNEEVAAAFAASTQKYLLGTDGDAFEDKTKWSAFIGSIFEVSMNSEGQIPQFGQLTQPSMQPMTEHFSNLCKRMSAATGIHAGQFGIVGDNPSSADAIYLENSPLILKCKTFIKEAKTALSRVAIAAAATELGKSYAEAEEACDVSVNFLNPAMPTLAQQTDSSIKLASAVDGFAGTPTFWRLNGLDDDEVRNVMSEIRRNVTRPVAFDVISAASQEQAKTAQEQAKTAASDD